SRAERRERIAQLVAEHREKLRLAAVRFAQRLLRFLTVGDVDAGRLRLDAAAVLVEPERSIRPQRPAHAFGRLEAVLDPDLRRGGRQLIEHRANGRTVFVGDEVPEAAADQRLGGRAAGTRIAAVREQDLAVRPESADHLRLRVDDRAVTLLAPAQGLLDA